MSTKWPATEVELARPIVEWLIDLGWEVFQEVELYQGGARADIVARRGAVLWAVEVKRTLSLALLGQALEWTQRTHRVSVAIPHGRTTSARRFALRAAASEGIGVLEASLLYDGEVKVVELGCPQLRRRVLGVRLHEAQKTWADAGNAAGKRWSPFQQTCVLVRAAVEAAPGLTVREVVDRVDHHYKSTSSARGSLLGWARSGSIEGVEVRGGTKETGFFRLYPAGWQGPLRE